MRISDDGKYYIFDGVFMPVEEPQPWTIVLEPAVGNTTINSILIRDYDPSGKTVTRDTPGENMFKTRAPQDQGSLKALKLTAENVREVAGEIAKAGLDITWHGSEEFTAGEGDLDICEATFVLGDWVVEDYDFDINHVIFRVADNDERREYNLR